MSAAATISETASENQTESFAGIIADLDNDMITSIRERWFAKVGDPERNERLAIIDAELARRSDRDGAVAKSETVSDKQPARRGRPRAFNYDAMGDLLRFVRGDVHTRRGDQNILYRQRALAVLENGFPWLADTEAMRAGAPNAWKPGILTELGRIESEMLLRKCAAFICRRQPATVREGERMVRAWRNGIATYFTLRLMSPGYSRAGALRGARYERRDA